MKKKHHIHKKNKAVNKVKKETILPSKPILSITLKSFLIIIIIGIAIFYLDYKGYFNPNETNNHTKRKWDAFYEFSNKNNVDVLLLGNSHLYSGINPKNLSATLGVNAFILASPGTNIADSYFGLKESLKKTNPKLVIIETYGINEFNPYELEEGALSDQFKSFYARKDFITKVTSTPLLFKSDNYFYAWSNTIRNHDFIFNDTTQLAKNRILINSKKKKNTKLYLGRYVRFLSGIENDIIKKYDSVGAPVNGANYSYNEFTEKYVNKIIELCNNNNIELMFLTLPMYYKHIDKYTDWRDELATILKKYPNKWLNLQLPYDTTQFTPICFENTYSSNQHMTYNGSLIATYKLANFIKYDINVELPNRKNETKWKNIFYGQEGYFENNPVSVNDKKNILLCEDFPTNNVVLKEVSIINTEKGKNKIIIAKVAKKKNDLSKCKLRLALSFVQNQQLEIANIDLQYDILHQTKDMFIFKTLIKPIEIKAIKAGVIMCE